MAETRSDDGPVGAAKKHQAAEVAALFGDDAGGTTVGRAVTINRPVADVWAFYRDLANAPLYMDDIEQVAEHGGRSHWVARGAGGSKIEWDSEITEDVPEQVLAWHAVDQSHHNTGRITFAHVPGRGTVVTMTLSYDSPGGIVGKVIEKLRQTDPAIQARRNLRRLKQLLETGEIATAARNKALDAEGKTHE